MDPHELLMTALRALGVYLLMLVVVRVLGKRTVGNFKAAHVECSGAVSVLRHEWARPAQKKDA